MNSNLKLPNYKTDNELAYWLVLHHISGIGPRTVRNLKTIFASWEELFSASPKILAKINLSEKIIADLKNPPWHKVEQDLVWLAKSKTNHILTLDDPCYPSLLSEIHAPPFVLFISGNIETLAIPGLAMVGSRKPTHSGLETAKKFAGEFAAVGLPITSGLAIGIDTAAHIGALEAGGKTIAVLGTGVDTIYPMRNISIAENILEKNGLLVSELPLGTTAKPENFPQRNRIISGLSLGTLIVEANERSGSLITARYALEQGREVFAIPGSIYNAAARGCHKLLKEGAKLVENIDDVLNELATFSANLQAYTPSAFSKNKENKLDRDHKKLLECIGGDLITVDMLVERSGFAVATVMSILTVLELDSLVKTIPGGYLRI